jgi:hypothetical protein
VVGSTIYGTAATAGVPFGPPTVSVTGTVTVGSVTTPTASAGPNHWNTASNWTLNAVPVSTDDVDLMDCTIDILYGLDQSGVTLNSLNIYSTFTGKIGLPTNNPLGYVEYLDTYLKIGATTMQVGLGLGSGSSMLKINNVTIQTTLTVFSTGTPATTGAPALWWIGTHASNIVNALGGYIGLAWEQGTVATLDKLFIGSGSVPPTVFSGPGVTLGTGTTQGGSLRLQGGATTIEQVGGTVTTEGNATCNITTYKLKKGNFVWNAPGAITFEANGSVVDLTQDPRPKTITNGTFYHGSELRDPNKRSTWSNPLSTPDGVQGPGNPVGAIIDFGKQSTVQRT